MKIISKIILSIVVFLIIATLTILGYIICTEIDFFNNNPIVEVSEFRTEINEKVRDKETSNIIINNNKVTNTKIEGLESINNSKNKENNNTSINDQSEKTLKSYNYFYNQLNKYSVKIYEGLYKNKENMKTGTYKIELGNYFTDVLNKENGAEVLSDYYQSAIEAYVYDNPDIFYLDPQKMYLNMETTTKGNKKTYNIFIDNGDKPNYFEVGFNSKADVEASLNAIDLTANKILRNKTNNTYENIKMVHDYLIDNLEYDTTLSGGYIYDIYGAMVNKVAVCEGYAKSFKYLMDRLGIPSTLAIGTATNSNGETEKHAWNYVKVEKNWYAVDVTWDDPITQTGFISNKSKYKYFLKGLDIMEEDHVVNGQFTTEGKVFLYPDVSRQNYKK